MLKMTDLAAVRLLAQNRLERQRLSALSLDTRPTDEAAAYAMQAQLHRELVPKLGKIAGHKIGCTTAVMQRFLNIPNSCAGGVFANTVHQSGVSISHSDFVRPGVECEIVVFLQNDLPPINRPYTQETVTAAVGAIAAGIEIVDDRYVDYKSLDTPTLIADDFFDAGCVIGTPIRNWRAIDIPALVGRTLINGNEAGKGVARDVMGHPFAALAWLANSLIARGQYLKRDEFVFTGSVVETRWINAGDHITVEIAGLGITTVAFV
jgi:2-keto-4-pentenoate hydratase